MEIGVKNVSSLSYVRLGQMCSPERENQHKQQHHNSSCVIVTSTVTNTNAQKHTNRHRMPYSLRTMQAVYKFQCSHRT